MGATPGRPKAGTTIVRLQGGSEMIIHTQGARRAAHRQEHLLHAGHLATASQIAQYRFSNFRQDGKTKSLAALLGRNVNQLLTPVEVADAKVNGLTYAKSIGGDQAQNRIVTLSDQRRPIRHGE